MGIDASADMKRRSRGLGPEGPLVRTRRATTVGIGVLAVVAVAVALATRTPAAVVLFAPALLPAVVGAVVIIVATTARERRILGGETLAARPWWAKPQGMALAIAGATLIILGAITLEAGLIAELDSVTFWGEPQTAAQTWEEDWGFVIAGVGAIVLLLGAVLFPVAAIKAATARAARLQSR